MIRFRDAAVLAMAKLHTRRVRTVITVILSSVLFAVIIAAFIVANGAIKSFSDFNSQGLNGRYLVTASADPRLAGGVLTNENLLALAKQDYKNLVIKKTAEAKRLGVAYDPSTEPEAVVTRITPSGLSSHESIDISSPAAQQAIREYLQAHPGPGMNELKKIASPYNPATFYTDTPATLYGGQIQTMPNGEEDFAGGKDFFSGIATKMSSKLTDPFVDKNITLGKGNVPLVISYTRAEQILGLATLSKSASVHEQYERVQKLYDALDTGKLTVTTCYRNTASADQIATAVTQAGNVKVAEDAGVRYALPIATSCGAAKTTQDSRTDAEKQQSAAQLTFDEEFDLQSQVPEQKKITFQVVGLYSDVVSNSGNLSFFGLLSSITGSSLDGGDVIPANMLEGVGADTKNILFSGKDQFDDIQPTYTVEFSNAQDAKRFVQNASCATRSSGTCASPGKPFNLTAYGNNTIALAGVGSKISRWLVIVAIVVAVFAAIIMSTMVGRMIVDGRKESAVFRALGARRSDITVIYSVYTFVLTVLVLIVSFGFGILGAFFISQYFGMHATEQVRLLFGAANTDLRVQLFRLDAMQMGAITIGIVIVGAVSTVVPLMRNVRRSPISDLREE